MNLEDRFHLIPAVFVLLIKKDKIFLTKRINTGYKDGEWSLIGGHLEGGETARQAAVREVKEEIGVTIEQKDLHFFNVAHLITNSERIHFSFFADKWEGNPMNNEPNTATEAEWFPINNLPDNTTDLSKATINWYKGKIAYSEFGWEK
jgi:mutator protein MutT